MDMKQILQALDKASSRKVEGANDMRRFVSIVQENNTLKAVADKIAAAGDAAKEKLSDFRPYDEKAVAKMYGVKTANNTNKKEDSDLDEAGKPSDPNFKPNLQVPQAPPFPEGDFSKPGPYDLGNGEKLTVNQDGTRVHASGSGTFTYDKAGKAIKYATPSMNGFSQEHDLVTGNITVSYMEGPLKVVHTYDKTGKQTGDSNSEYDMGTQTVAQKRTAGGQVQNTVTPAGGAPQPAPATEGKRSFLDYLTLAEKKQKGVAEETIRPNLAAALTEIGFKGPFKLGQLPKWMAEFQDGKFDEDTSIMIAGDDHEYDPWVAKGNDYGYAYGVETGYQTGLSAQQVLKKATEDIAGLKEEKQKGVDGKACWDGYKRMGTKKKGGKTVDNCVKDGK